MADKSVHKLQGRRMVTQMSPRPPHDLNLEVPAEQHKDALKRIIDGGVATKVRILASHDSCPACKAYEGAYEFDEVPALPNVACSHAHGCRCHYAPVLDRFGP